MKKEDISDALNFLDDDLLEETNALRMTPKKKPSVIQIVSGSPWVKWGSMAAALVIIVGAVGINVLPGLFKSESKFDSENAIEPTLMSIAGGERDSKCMVASDEYSNDCEVLRDGIFDLEACETTEAESTNGFITGETVSLNYAPVCMSITFTSEKSEDGIIDVYYSGISSVKASLNNCYELWVEENGEWKPVEKKGAEQKTENRIEIECDESGEKISTFSQSFSLKEFDISKYIDRLHNYRLTKKVIYIDEYGEYEGEISCEFSR